jgi:hypothetical protein
MPGLPDLVIAPAMEPVRCPSGYTVLSLQACCTAFVCLWFSDSMI